MIRDFDRLSDGPFDLLVVGGGIYGAWVAYDASLRGLKVALVEQRDWAAATSSASSKLIHGGLRYLDQGRFGLLRKALRERERLLRLAPHRVRPQRFAVPVYSDARVRRRSLGLGLWIHDRLAGRLSSLERHRSLSRRAMAGEYEFLNPVGLLGGFTYEDCIIDDARCTLELVDGATNAGTVAVNRARASELLVDGSSVVGARVEDVETGESIEVRAGVTANCAGPWSQSLIETALPSSSPIARLSKGIHLVLPALAVEDAFLLISREHGGVVFLVPWYGRTLLGTTDTEFDGDPSDLRVDTDDRAYLLEQVNRVLDKPTWSESDVISDFAGLRTVPVVRNRPTTAASRELTLEKPLENLITPVGGTYTSARADAAWLVDLVLWWLARPHEPTPTDERPFPWCPAERFGSWVPTTLARGLRLGIDEATVHSCQMRYGTRIDRLFDLIVDEPELAARIQPDAPFCLAEIVHAVEYEMARSLEDVLRRRVPLSLLSPPAQATLSQVADLIGPLLGWSDHRKHEEVAAAGGLDDALRDHT